MWSTFQCVPIGYMIKDLLFIYFSEIEYHHAFTQTGPTMDQIQKVKNEKCSRDTQTIELRQISMVRCY